MKTNSILLLLCIVLLSSCAGKFGVMKRRYNKGFYVSVSGDNKTTSKQNSQARANAPRQATEQVITTSAESVQNRKVPVLAAKPEVQQKRSAEQTIIPAAARATSVEKGSALSTNISASAGSTQRSSFKAKALAREIKAQLKSAENKDSGVEPIILIILCLLIPPLAVYLFHKALNADFWLSLILTLLFWVPGVIFAFLVCFAGVSIA